MPCASSDEFDSGILSCPRYPSMHCFPWHNPYTRNKRRKDCLIAGPSRVLVGKNGSHEFHVVDLSAAGVNRLQQLIHFIVAHFLAQVGQNVSQLAHADKSRHVFVEYLEPATVFFWFAGISETAGSIEDFAERVEIDCNPC